MKRMHSDHQESTKPSRVTVLGPASAACVAFVSLTVFAGWQFDVAVFKSVIPSLVAMNPLTALLFLVSAAWLFVAFRRPGAWFFLASLAAIVLGASALKLASFAGFDLSIDHILYARDLLSYDPPNSMAPNTALNFFVMGLAMLIYKSRVKSAVFIAQLSALFAGTLAFLALVGYLYGAGFLYTIGPFIGMALHTALLFIVFLVGFLSLSPHEGMMRVLTSSGSGGTMSRQLLSVALVVPFFFGLASVLGERYGYYSMQSGTVFIVVGLIVIFGIFIWRDAARVEAADEDLRRVIADLEEKEDKLEDAQAMEGLGYWRWNVKTGAVEWSGEVYKIFRLDPKTFTPQIDSILKLSPWPGDHERNTYIIDRAVKSHEPGSYEQKFLRPDGEIGYYHSTFRGKYDEKGELVLLVGTIMDITERKKAEEKMREVDRAKTEFVSIASHQLRTPLTTVNWYSEMLLQKEMAKTAARQREYLRKIHQGSERMVMLVNALLNVSRIELGTLTVDPKQVDVAALVRDVVSEQKPKSNEQKVRVVVIIPAGLPQIETDPNLLRVVVQNLLSNAIKYTPAKGRVTIALSTEDQWLTVTVSDTGLGIPKNEQGKIFTKMFRADNIKEKGLEGTGLGLYIVRSVLDALGGTIGFESEENKGARFFVRLPQKVPRVESVAGPVAVSMPMSTAV